jgi:hypothetical protein
LLSDLLSAVVLMFLVLAFYRLFNGVFGELAIMLWLVIKGANPPALTSAAASLIRAPRSKIDSSREQGHRSGVRPSTRAGSVLPL